LNPHCVLIAGMKPATLIGWMQGRFSPYEALSRGNTLLEICTGYKDIKDIRVVINVYREKIDFSKEFLTDIVRILKKVCWIYLNINQISVDDDQRVKI